MNMNINPNHINDTDEYNILTGGCPDNCTANCVNGNCVDPCPGGCPDCHTCQSTGCEPDYDSNKCESCDSKTCSVVDKCDPKNCLQCDGKGRCVTTCLSCERCDDGTCVEDCSRAPCEKCTKNITTGRASCEPVCTECETCFIKTTISSGSTKKTAACAYNDNKCNDAMTCSQCKIVNGRAKCESTCTDPCKDCQRSLCVDIVQSACYKCDPQTGSITSQCKKCEVCKGDPGAEKCVPKTCNSPCDKCNPDTGECDITCAKCERCEISSGGAKCVDNCKSCSNCSKTTGNCESTCSKCEKCIINSSGNDICVDYYYDEPCYTCVLHNGKRSKSPIANGSNCEACNSTGKIYSVCTGCDECDGNGNCKTTCDSNQCLSCRQGQCESNCSDCSTCSSGYCQPKECGPCEDCLGGQCFSQCDNAQPYCGGTSLYARSLCDVESNTCVPELIERCPGPCPSCEGTCGDGKKTYFSNYCASGCDLDEAKQVGDCCEAGGCSPSKTDCTPISTKTEVKRIDKGVCQKIEIKRESCITYTCERPKIKKSRKECCTPSCYRCPGNGCSRNPVGGFGHCEGYRTVTYDALADYTQCVNDTSSKITQKILSTYCCSGTSSGCCGLSSGYDFCCPTSPKYDPNCCNPSNPICCSDPTGPCCLDPDSKVCECESLALNDRCCGVAGDPAAYKCCTENKSPQCCEESDDYDKACCDNKECCPNAKRPGCCPFSVAYFGPECCNAGTIACCPDSGDFYDPVCCPSSDEYNPACCNSFDNPDYDPVCCPRSSEYNAACCSGNCYTRDDTCSLTAVCVGKTLGAPPSFGPGSCDGNSEMDDYFGPECDELGGYWAPRTSYRCVPDPDPCCGIDCSDFSMKGCPTECRGGYCEPKDWCCVVPDHGCCEENNKCGSDFTGCRSYCYKGECRQSGPCCPSSDNPDIVDSPVCCPTDPQYDPCLCNGCESVRRDCYYICDDNQECIKKDQCCGIDCSLAPIVINGETCETECHKGECLIIDSCCGVDCSEPDSFGCKQECKLGLCQPISGSECCESHPLYNEECCKNPSCCEQSDSYNAECCKDPGSVCCTEPDDICCTDPEDICCKNSDDACCTDPKGTCCSDSERYNPYCCDGIYGTKKDPECCLDPEKCCSPNCSINEDNGCVTTCVNGECVLEDVCCGVDCSDIDGCSRHCENGLCVYDDPCCPAGDPCCESEDKCCQINNAGGCPAMGECAYTCIDGICEKDDPCCGVLCNERTGCETCIGGECVSNCDTTGECPQECLPLITTSNANRSITYGCGRKDLCCGVDCSKLSNLNGCEYFCVAGLCVPADPCCAEPNDVCCRNPGDVCCPLRLEAFRNGITFPPANSEGCAQICINIDGKADFIKQDPCCPYDRFK